MDQSYELGPANLDHHLTSEDLSQLKALSLVHYIFGGIGMVLSLFTLIHVFLGLAIITGNIEADGAEPFVGWLFFCLGLVFLVLGEAASIAMILSGRHLKRRTGYMFSFVVACIVCLSVPIGTILGVFTIIVLNRPTVKAAYGKH